MCRIASLFLLQRLKGSMSGNVRDFNNIETRAVIKFFLVLLDKAPKKMHTILTETLREHAPSYSTVKTDTRTHSFHSFILSFIHSFGGLSYDRSVKLMLSHYIPGQALRFPDGCVSQNILIIGT